MRKQGWEQRLDQVIANAMNAPYVLGTHDCMRVACQAYEALLLIDLWPKIAGQYSTHQEAISLIRQWGSSYEQAFTKFFQMPTTNWRHARRGDIGVYQDDSGMKHLGVCIGSRTAMLAENGLIYLRNSLLDPYWRIG